MWRWLWSPWIIYNCCRIPFESAFFKTCCPPVITFYLNSDLPVWTQQVRRMNDRCVIWFLFWSFGKRSKRWEAARSLTGLDMPRKKFSFLSAKPHRLDSTHFPESRAVVGMQTTENSRDFCFPLPGKDGGKSVFFQFLSQMLNFRPDLERLS